MNRIIINKLADLSWKYGVDDERLRTFVSDGSKECEERHEHMKFLHKRLYAQIEILKEVLYEGLCSEGKD